MAAMKLNTLHWHIVDAESFPYDSEEFPELKAKASYSPTATYSKEMILAFVEYARDRGVRVVPEFDTPGHTASVGQAYPDLIADCYDWLVESNGGQSLRWPMFNDVALDITKQETKVFVEQIIAELAPLFPDNFFHIGGDEVNQGCWNAVPSILTWMEANGFATIDAVGEWEYDFTSLQGSWATFVQNVTKANNKRAVVWEESFTLGFDLAPDTVVHIWIPDDGTAVLQRAIEAGYQVILSNGWYLDRQAPTCVDDLCDVNWMWMWSGRDMYAVEPLAPSMNGWVPTEAEATQILGGEAASWGESVDDKNFDVRVWSRAPGIAERLWSPNTNTDPWDLQPRISVLACKLARRGVQIADSQPAFCDYYDGHL